MVKSQTSKTGKVRWNFLLLRCAKDLPGRECQIPGIPGVNKTSGNQVRSGNWAEVRLLTSRSPSLNVLLAGAVFALLQVWDWESLPSAKNRTVHTWISCLYSSGRISSYSCKHRHAAVWNAFPAVKPGSAAVSGCSGCSRGCDSGISVFVLSHSPSLWGDDSPEQPEGVKPEIGRA